MSNNLTGVLETYSDDAHFGTVVRGALRILASATCKDERFPAQQGQSSSKLADLYEFRKKIYSYKDNTIPGLDETIKNLRSKEVIVRLGVIETDNSVIGMWLDDRNLLAGIVVVKPKSDERAALR